MLNLAIITSFLSKTKDRFHEYNEPLDLDGKFKLLSEIEGYSGVEIVHPYEVNDAKETKAALAKYNLGVAAVNVNVKAEPEFRNGGGPGCSGQLLVTPDVLGLYDNFTPSFAKQYQNFGEVMIETFKQYRAEVLSGEFPGEKHSYKMSDEVLEAIVKEFG